MRLFDLTPFLRRCLLAGLAVCLFAGAAAAQDDGGGGEDGRPEPPARFPLFRPSWQTQGADGESVRQVLMQLGLQRLRRIGNELRNPRDRKTFPAMAEALEKSRVRMRARLVRLFDEPLKSALISFDATPAEFGDALRLARLTEAEKTQVAKLFDAARERIDPRGGVVLSSHPVITELNMQVRAELPAERQRWLDEMLFGLGQTPQPIGDIDVPEGVLPPPDIVQGSGRLISIDTDAGRVRFAKGFGPSMHWMAGTVFVVDGRAASYKDLRNERPIVCLANGPADSPRLIVQCAARPMAVQDAKLVDVDGRRLTVASSLGDVWTLDEAAVVVDDNGPAAPAGLEPGMTVSAVLAGVGEARRAIALWIRNPDDPATFVRRGVMLSRARRYGEGYRQTGTIPLTFAPDEEIEAAFDADTVFMHADRFRYWRFRVTPAGVADILKGGPITATATWTPTEGGPPRLLSLSYNDLDPDEAEAPLVTEMPPTPEPGDMPPYEILLPDSTPEFRTFDPWLMAGISTIQPQGRLVLTKEQTDVLFEDMRAIQDDLLAEVREYFSDDFLRLVDNYRQYKDQLGPHLSLLETDAATRARLRLILARWTPFLLTPGQDPDRLDAAKLALAREVFAALSGGERKSFVDLQQRVSGSRPLPRAHEGFRSGLRLLYLTSIDRDKGVARGVSPGGIYATGFREGEPLMRDGVPVKPETLSRYDRIVRLRFETRPQGGGCFLWTERRPVVVAGRIVRVTPAAVEIEGAAIGRLRLTAGTVVIDAKGARNPEALVEGGFVVAVAGGAPDDVRAWAVFVRPEPGAAYSFTETHVSSPVRQVRDGSYSLALTIRPDRTYDFRLTNNVELAWRRKPEDGREIGWEEIEGLVKRGELICYAMVSPPREGAPAGAPLTLTRIAVTPPEFGPDN